MSEGQKHYLTIKYAADFVIALIAAVVLLPVFLVLSVLIWIDDPGPVFFTQKRVGEAKKLFPIYKFRTMKTSTPHDVPTHLLKDPEQYITRMGRFMRKTSLDELPQIFNIIKGELSICGPRPALWNQYDLIEERDKYGANDIRPGLTGWAQIHGRDELEIEEKARLDGYYVKHVGLGLDVRCFFGTFLAVAKGDGVVEGGTGEMARKEHEKKKLLILTNHSYMLYRFRRELIAELMKKYEVVLSMPFVGHEEDFKAMGLRCIETEVDRRGINPFKDFRLFKTYYAMLKREKPELVITYSIKPNVYCGFVCSLLKIPYCANVQGLGTAFQKAGLAQFVTVLYKMAFRRVKTVFFENEVNAEEFRTRKILTRNQQTVLHGAGINLEAYEYCAFPENETTRFLYLGRIMKEKGMDELFAAVRRLRSEGEKFVLDFVGFFEDEYKEQVEQLQREGIAVFYGFQENPKPYYQAADCVVMPSYHEGMSNVLLEAAAMGRPVITTDIPGCREAVDHGKTGILCKVKDTESLYEAMKHFLTLSPEKRSAMGEAGRHKMELEFDKRAVVAETVEALEREME